VVSQPSLGVTWSNLNGSGSGALGPGGPYRTPPLYNQAYKLESVDLALAAARYMQALAQTPMASISSSISYIYFLPLCCSHTPRQYYFSN